MQFHSAMIFQVMHFLATFCTQGAGYISLFVSFPFEGCCYSNNTPETQYVKHNRKILIKVLFLRWIVSTPKAFTSRAFNINGCLNPDETF